MQSNLISVNMASGSIRMKFSFDIKTLFKWLDSGEMEHYNLTIEFFMVSIDIEEHLITSAETLPFLFTNLVQVFLLDLRKHICWGQQKLRGCLSKLCLLHIYISGWKNLFKYYSHLRKQSFLYDTGLLKPADVSRFFSLLHYNQIFCADEHIIYGT